MVKRTLKCVGWLHVLTYKSFELRTMELCLLSSLSTLPCLFALLCISPLLYQQKCGVCECTLQSNNNSSRRRQNSKIQMPLHCQMSKDAATFFCIIKHRCPLSPTFLLVHQHKDRCNKIINSEHSKLGLTAAQSADRISSSQY